MADLRIQNHDLSARESEERQAAAAEIEEGQRQARQASSEVRVSAAEAGVAGMSVDALLGDIERDQAVHQSSVTDNLTISIDQLQRMRMGASADTANRVRSVPSASPWLTGLKIAGAGLDLAAGLKARKPKVPDGY